MYGRRQGGGRGFRPNNAVGMGTVASRSLTDGPGRGGLYNSYRKANRGFGRGQGRYYNSPQPLCKGDMFMEAGRLAAEYLVVKGMLPPNVLLSKFQNVGFRKEVGEFQEFRQQDGENLQTDSRARLGSFEGASDTKRYPYTYIAAGSKPNLRERRETGSLSYYDSDRGQENGKSGSISGRSRASSDKEADDDALSVHRDEQLTTKDDEQNNKVVESAPKSNGTENSLSEAVSDTLQLVTNLSSKTNVSVTGKDSKHLTDIEGGKESDGISNINVEDGKMSESKNNGVTAQYRPIEDSVIQPNQLPATPTRKGNELLQLCNFAKLPTRPRSLRSKGSKGTTVEEENNSIGTSTDAVVAKPIDTDVTDTSVVDTNKKMEQTPLLEENTTTGTFVDPELLVDDEVVGLSNSNTVLDENHDLLTNKNMAIDKSNTTFGKAVLLDHDSLAAEGSKCLESLSFPGSIDEFMSRERDEKRVLEDCDLQETFKKMKSWPPSIGQVDEYPQFSNFRTEGLNILVRNPPTNNLMMTGPDSSSCISGFKTLGNDGEDKLMIDSSFKICDLNFMERSHIDDNQDGLQMMFFPSMSESKKEPSSVDGGFSVGGFSNVSHKYSRIGAHGKKVEVINLDNDFEDETAFNNGEQREDAVYTGLESFPNQPRDTCNVTDVQEYRFMISELLGNEIPNCSTVTGDINSLHGDMDLHNGQGILPEDDDPIYMTLGEIPIGFWEPPNSDFGKPF